MRTKRIIFGIFSLVVLMILAMVLYFYIAFSGNPIERFVSKGLLLGIMKQDLMKILK